MRRLADGALALFSQRGAQVRTLADEDVRIDVGEALKPALIRLAHGVADDTATNDDDDELLAMLRLAKLAGENLDDVDPLVTARLRALGRGLAWRLDENDREVADYLRTKHARRKSSFLDFWQGPCVPECGAERVKHVLGRVPLGGRVFLVGDDDLLTLPLARAGLAITVIDIDETLIALLRALAAEEGLAIDARVLDLCEPLPGELVGAFDAALTDPQSSPAPMRAFTSRALAAVKDGGLLFVSVHDQFRRGFAALARELPIRPVAVHLGFGAYYTHGWEADPYRSDFLTLHRTSGAVPHPPEVRIPAAVFDSGEVAASDHHALGNARVMTLKRDAWLDIEALHKALAGSPHTSVNNIHTAATTDGVMLTAALEGGGHLTVRCDYARKQIGWSIAPLGVGVEEALVHALEQQLRFAKRDGLRGVPPHVGAPSYIFTPRR